MWCRAAPKWLCTTSMCSRAINRAAASSIRRAWKISPAFLEARHNRATSDVCRTPRNVGPETPAALARGMPTSGDTVNHCPPADFVGQHIRPHVEITYRPDLLVDERLRRQRAARPGRGREEEDFQWCTGGSHVGADRSGDFRRGTSPRFEGVGVLRRARRDPKRKVDDLHFPAGAGAGGFTEMRRGVTDRSGREIRLPRSAWMSPCNNRSRASSTRRAPAPRLILTSSLLNTAAARSSSFRRSPERFMSWMRR